MRLAWFSPLPPSRSGIAAYSAEIVPLLKSRYQAIDLFTDQEPSPATPGIYNARDFVWMHRRRPYDLTIFHMGNAACHDYMWAYLFRYPGLVVLHDPQLHQARALWLMRRLYPRRADYLAEFRANHPDAPPDAAELVAAGLGGTLYQHWPLIRMVLQRARLTVVHNRRVRDGLKDDYPEAAIEAIEMGVEDPFAGKTKAEKKNEKEKKKEKVVIGAFGGVTPEKRIPQLIRAFTTVAGSRPNVHLMLVGQQADHYDVGTDIQASGFADRIEVTGFVEDAMLPAYLEAADICACLRWPTNRETSASWLRCLAAGKATIVTALSQLIDIPMTEADEAAHADGVAMKIDILEEERLLPQALARLTDDVALRQQLGRAARDWWSTHYRLGAMAEAYAAVIDQAAQRAPGPIALPHLVADGTASLRAMASEPTLRQRLADLID